MRRAAPAATGASASTSNAQRLQGIAGEDRGGFVEGDVHGRPAAAQGVVVHRRQVVVHQRIGVDQFHRDRGRIQRAVVGAEQRGRLA